MHIFRLLRYSFAGGLGASVGWLLSEPWKDPYSSLREFLILFAVSWSIAFCLIAQKFFYAQATTAQRLEWLKNSVRKRSIWLIPLISLTIFSLWQSQNRDSYGNKHLVTSLDKFGNPIGDEFDLALDNSFEGKIILVLHQYTSEGFNFRQPQLALEEKGFIVRRLVNTPDLETFRNELAQANQLWLISDQRPVLSNDHISYIKDFHDRGNGIYIWGDNHPYYADANRVSHALFGFQMEGNITGNKVLQAKNTNSVSGFTTHPIYTGIENLFEGITIATIQGEGWKPLLFGSDGQVIAAVVESTKGRAIIDGGFTRLFVKWDTAGTARSVKNSAIWLAMAGGKKPTKTPSHDQESGFWSRILGWAICGLIIGLTIASGDEMRETWVIAPIGSFIGGGMSGLCFNFLSISGPYSRMLSFLLLGILIGICLYLVSYFYALATSRN